LDGFFQCGKFDETQLMPMFVCQRFHLSDIASPCKANHHCCHCPSPVKILAHPKSLPSWLIAFDGIWCG
jgi:hypothetical protein